MIAGPDTELIDRHEGVAARPGRTLVWLWPSELPQTDESTDTPEILRSPQDASVRGLALRPGESLTVLRRDASHSLLTHTDQGWSLGVPSTPDWLDVSRRPVVFSVDSRGGLFVSPPESKPIIWVDLSEYNGLGPYSVPDWAAVGIGPLVLWNVPMDPTDAVRHVTLVDQSCPTLYGGFRFYSQAMRDFVDDLRYRGKLREVTRFRATQESWTRGEPILLAGESGSGKTTLAASLAESREFNSINPISVSMDIALVKLYGAKNLAHDSKRVRDQDGALYTIVKNENAVLLIDEVHTTDQNFTNRLMELLTWWTYQPMGDNQTEHRISGHIVLATNRIDLIRDPDQFAQDLFNRLGGNHAVCHVPPLRQRRFEIRSMAQAALDARGLAVSMSNNAIRKLCLHNWPRNHWGLDSALKDAALKVAKSGERICAEHLILRADWWPYETTQRTPEVSAPVAPAATGAPPPGAPPAALSASVPATLGFRYLQELDWKELFASTAAFRSYKDMYTSYRKQFGHSAANARRYLGRRVRCDHFFWTDCAQCLLCQLHQHSTVEFLSILDGVAESVNVPASTRVSWAIHGFRLLIQERSRQNLPDRDALTQSLAACSKGAGIQALVPLIDEIKRQVPRPG